MQTLAQTQTLLGNNSLTHTTHKYYLGRLLYHEKYRVCAIEFSIEFCAHRAQKK